ARSSIACAVSLARLAHAIAELVVPRSIPTLYRGPPGIWGLRKLDFGRCDDGAGRRVERGKLHAGRAPPRMDERATERRLAGHIPDEMDLGWIDPLIVAHGHGLAFPTRKDGLERHVAFEHPMAARVNVTHGGADLRVGVPREVLTDEIDEPAFALQQGQHLDAAIRCI